MSEDEEFISEREKIKQERELHAKKVQGMEALISNREAERNKMNLLEKKKDQSHKNEQRQKKDEANEEYQHLFKPKNTSEVLEESLNISRKQREQARNDKKERRKLEEHSVHNESKTLINQYKNTGADDVLMQLAEEKKRREEELSKREQRRREMERLAIEEEERERREIEEKRKKWEKDLEAKLNRIDHTGSSGDHSEDGDVDLGDLLNRKGRSYSSHSDSEDDSNHRDLSDSLSGDDLESKRKPKGTSNAKQSSSKATTGKYTSSVDNRGNQKRVYKDQQPSNKKEEDRDIGKYDSRAKDSSYRSNDYDSYSTKKPSKTSAYDSYSTKSGSSKYTDYDTTHSHRARNEPEDYNPRRDTRDNRDARDSRDARDTRDARDARDARDTRDKRDARDARDTRDTRDSRDGWDSSYSKASSTKDYPSYSTYERRREREDSKPLSYDYRTDSKNETRGVGSTYSYSARDYPSKEYGSSRDYSSKYTSKEDRFGTSSRDYLSSNAKEDRPRYDDYSSSSRYTKTSSSDYQNPYRSTYSTTSDYRSTGRSGASSYGYKELDYTRDTRDSRDYTRDYTRDSRDTTRDYTSTRDSDTTSLGGYGADSWERDSRRKERENRIKSLREEEKEYQTKQRQRKLNSRFNY
uniref:Uncharacterized protein n=1 Tax=Arcella intermedia TaxID=1963864 RepID=A0A6B2KZG7_9EUKA